MVTARFPRLENAEVHKQGHTILGPLSLDNLSSPCTVIMGPVGAGKSTLLKVFYGLERLSCGSRTVDTDVDIQQQKIVQAFVFQHPVLLRRSLWENIAYPLRVRGVSRHEARRQACEWLERMDLSRLMNNSAYALSGGQQQKMALARSLIVKPDLVYLDEPTSHLDDATTHDIEMILLDIIASGTRIMLATHNSGQAQRLGNDIIFLLNGTVCERQNVNDFFKPTQNDALKTYLNGGLVI